MERISNSNDASRIKDERSDYISAQRASSEAINVCRETMSMCAQQSEQIRNADLMLDKQKYMVDQTARKLRDLTWTGWIANKMTSNVAIPDSLRKTIEPKEDFSISASKYEHSPTKMTPLTQSIINYHCNVTLLQDCQDDRQFQECNEICNSLFDIVNKELYKVELISPFKKEELDFLNELKSDKKHIRDLQYRLSLSRNKSDVSNINLKEESESSLKSNRKNLNHCKYGHKNLNSDPNFGGDVLLHSGKENAESSNNDKIRIQQDHLSILSSDLGLLKDMGHEINQSFSEQNTTLESLGDKAESLADSTSLLSRKANRMIMKTKLISPKSEFMYWVTIQHLPSKTYLTTNSSGALIFSNELSNACMFGVWKKRDSVVGLQNRLTRKWLGQTFFGSIVCSASTFSSREEWEIDLANIKRTRLLCACANWGSGGWIDVVNETNSTKEMCVIVKGYDLKSKSNSTFWSLITHEIE